MLVTRHVDLVPSLQQLSRGLLLFAVPLQDAANVQGMTCKSKQSWSCSRVFVSYWPRDRLPMIAAQTCNSPLQV